jgi:hypothetical protein
MLTRAAAAAALACAVAACAREPARTAAPSPAAVATVDPVLRATQQKLVEADRAAREKSRAAIARVATGSARDVTLPAATVERFVVTVTNRGARTIDRVDGGVVVYDGVSLKRLGLASFSAPAQIAPRRTTALRVAIPMTAFAEGAGPLARTAGRPKHVELELTGFGIRGGGGASERD